MKMRINAKDLEKLLHRLHHLEAVCKMRTQELADRDARLSRRMGEADERLGRLLARILDHGVPRESIVSAYHKAYDVSLPTAESSVSDLLTDLEES